MAYEIKRENIIGVARETNQVLCHHGFNHGETVLGLAELIGHVVADVSKNHIQAEELIELVVGHIRGTVKQIAEVGGKPLVAEG